MTITILPSTGVIPGTGSDCSTSTVTITPLSATSVQLTYSSSPFDFDINGFGFAYTITSTSGTAKLAGAANPFLIGNGFIQISHISFGPFNQNDADAGSFCLPYIGVSDLPGGAAANPPGAQIITLPNTGDKATIVIQYAVGACPPDGTVCTRTITLSNSGGGSKN